MGNANISQLTDAQKQAINILDNNLQIIACAGSGKTDTIVNRIVNILKTGKAEPQHIVAFTFTEKAGTELRERIYSECEKQLRTINGLAEMYIGTIHGYCLELLQEFDYKYLKFSVLNEIQTKLFVDKTYKENGFTDVVLKDGKKLNRYKDSGIYIDAINTLREADKTLPKKYLKLINKYERTFEKNNYFDYTAILYKAIDLLENNQKVKEHIKNNIKYLIVDEYQDINPIQEKLIYHLYQHGVNICVVGDDDQTIYHWRGSKVENIIKFCDRYSNVKQVKLLENFRSSEGIVKASETCINHNKKRLQKTIISANKQIFELNDIMGKSFEIEEDEIDFIVEKIKQLHGVKFKDKNGERGLTYSDMAILVYSVKKIPPYLLEKLDENEIEFVVEGMKNLFETQEIIASVNIFYYLSGDCTEKELKQSWVDTNIGLDEESLDYAIQELKAKSPSKCKNWEEFNLQRIYLEFLLDIDIYNIKHYLKDRVLYNIAKFTQVINDYAVIHMKTPPNYKSTNFSNFLKYNASDYYPEGWLAPNFSTTKGLKIMTFFQAKGLEFPVAFMPFLTKHFMFPPSHGGRTKWHIIGDIIDKNSYENDDEDLRRLFYVGITRSQKFLFMSNSPHPYGNNKFYKKIADSFREVLHCSYVSQDIDYDFNDREHMETKEINKMANIAFDFTTLKEFFECPNKFMYSHIYGFSQPMDYRMGYGRSIHNILTEIHKSHLDGKMTDEKQLDEIIDQHFYLPYAPPKLEEDMLKTARKDMLQYLEDNRDSFDEIVYVEKKIEFNLGCGVFVQGRIDLIKNTKTGQIKIIDFKSNKLALERDLERNQLLTYALGYFHLTVSAK